VIITLLRHVKTTAPEGICYGQSDLELAEGYPAMHREIASRLANTHYSAIYTSPLTRCKTLAQELLRPGVSCKPDERLMELNFGEWEQKPWRDIETSAHARRFFDDFVETTPPGGESFRMLANRVGSFLSEKRAEHTGHSILVVTHGGPIRAFRAIIENLPLKEAFNMNVPFGGFFTFALH